MEYTTEYGYQWGKLDSTNATNIGKCALRCNITQDCCMFSYSQKNKIDKHKKTAKDRHR